LNLRICFEPPPLSPGPVPSSSPPPAELSPQISSRRLEVLRRLNETPAASGIETCGFVLYKLLDPSARLAAPLANSTFFLHLLNLSFSTLNMCILVFLDDLLTQ
jgi:hypothetical protein